MRKSTFVIFFLLVSVLLSAQTMVYLENADSLIFDEAVHGNAQVLHGNVQFRHDDALMYCDSAYFYEGNNSLDAMGHVKFVQGDTLFGFCDYLFYDGNSKFARMRKNVELINNQTHLTTDSLNYDRIKNVAWYWTNGQLQDTINTLTSVWGQYEPNTNTALFSNHVHLVNPRFTMDADTLTYNTESHIAFMIGKTTIVYEEETTIYSTLGQYDTSTEQAVLYDHSLISHADGKTMTGDTLYYDKQHQWGWAKRNMEITDSVKQVTLYGNYGEMHEKQWPKGSYSFATDSALMIDWSDSTNFTYIHADTLHQTEIPYTVIDSLMPRDSLLVDSVLTFQAPDTIWRDTSYQIIRAYYGARIYRSDFQAVADSCVYLSRDSLMILYNQPICWNDNQQISADIITIFFADSTLDYAHGMGNCIAIQQQTDSFFNQLAGKEMFAYIVDGEMRRVDVSGNAETIFFPQDESNGQWLGVNKTQSSYVKLFIENQKIHHVLFTSATTGTMYPIKQLSTNEMHLAQFFWADAERPRVPGDVFLHPQKTTRPAATPTTDENVKQRGDNPLKAKKPTKKKSEATAEITDETAAAAHTH